MEEREQNTIERRIKEAHLPKVKTLEEFRFSDAPHIPAAKLKELTEGGYIGRAEPVLFIGDSGTGKTHLLTALCVAACRQKRPAAYVSWMGTRLDGKGIDPDIQIDWSYEAIVRENCDVLSPRRALGRIRRRCGAAHRYTLRATASFFPGIGQGAESGGIQTFIA